MIRVRIAVAALVRIDPQGGIELECSAADAKRLALALLAAIRGAFPLVVSTPEVPFR